MTPTETLHLVLRPSLRVPPRGTTGGALLLLLLLTLLAACNRDDHAEHATPAATAADEKTIRIGDLALRVDAEYKTDRRVQIGVQAQRNGEPVHLRGTGDAVMPAMGSMPEMHAGIAFAQDGHGLTGDVELTMAGEWFPVLTLDAGGQTVTLHFALNTGDRSFVFQYAVPPSIHGGSGTAPAMASVSGSAQDAPRIHVPQARRQKIGVTFAAATMQTLTPRLDAFGRVEVNEESLADVNLRAEGWVREVFAKTVGEPVRAGQPLFRLESPMLQAAQEEFLIALQSGDDALLAAASAKLDALGFTDAQVRTLREKRRADATLTIRAPRDGFVVAKEVVEGQRVDNGMTAYRIGNLGKVWILADVFEADVPLLSRGARGVVSLPWLRGRSVEGKIVQIYPTVDPKSRTLPVRLELRNVGETLKPGMFVDVTLDGAPQHGLTIPRTALLYAGETGFVFVDAGDGYLEPRRVEPGVTVGDMVFIRSGLQEGERVSTSANFLLSSEAQLRNALPKWNGAGAPEAPAPAAAAHNHGHEGH